MAVKAGYLLAAGIGGVLLYSGIRGHSWSSVLRSVATGQPIPQTTELAIQTSGAAYGYGSGSGSTGPLPSGGGTPAKNQAIAKILAAPYGWATGPQWDDLVKLWTQESSWNNHARNPSSGAYGIPQSLPASKMGTLANPPVSSAAAQIVWGLKDIKQVYGSPSAAWAHEEAVGWY
jgi:resuscitation-promoting factor RpfB